MIGVIDKADDKNKIHKGFILQSILAQVDSHECDVHELYARVCARNANIIIL